MIDELRIGLRNIVGLRLFLAAHAADMRGFGFRKSHSTDETWFLHISCAWRIEDDKQIITGSSDWHEPELEKSDPGEEWDPARGGSLQEAKLRALFCDQDRSKRTISNNTDHLIARDIDVDVYGGCIVGLTGGFRIRIFPAGARGEFWRVFKKGADHHWVCS